MGFSSHVILFSLHVPNWLIIFSFSYSNSGVEPPVLLDRILHTCLVTGQPVVSCSWPRHPVICQSCSRASTEPLLSAGTWGRGSFPSDGRMGVAVTMIVTWLAMSGGFCFLNLFPLHSLFPGFTSVSPLFELDCQRCLPVFILFYSSYCRHHDLSETTYMISLF